jgi:hypothetical protein
MKKIPWAERYEVSENGIVFDTLRGRYLNKRIGKNGYEYVNMVIDGRRVIKSVHRIVGRVFVDGYDPTLDINHIDGIKTNNVFSNLEWVTRRQNIQHAYKNNLRASQRGTSKLKNAKPIIGIDKNGIRYYFNTQEEAAKKTGAKRGNISKVLTGHRSHAAGFQWIYQEVRV